MSDQLEMFDPQIYLSPFDRLARMNEYGDKYWSARDMMAALEYSEWRNFKPVIKRAMTACKNSDGVINDQFVVMHELIEHGKGGLREIENYRLTEDACYFIIINSDPSKKVVAEAHAYFVQLVKNERIRRQREADQAKQKRDKAISAYYSAGRSLDWSERRVDSKQAVKQLNGSAMATHEHRAPDFGSLHSTINRDLFDMTKSEIVAYLGLQPKQADAYRDHLSQYALNALKRISEVSSAKMKQAGRALTDAEQLNIVRRVVQIIAPTERELADFVGVDFISGTELGSNGQPMTPRNVPLLKDGAA